LTTHTALILVYGTLILHFSYKSMLIKTRINKFIFVPQGSIHKKKIQGQVKNFSSDNIVASNSIVPIVCWWGTQLKF